MYMLSDHTTVLEELYIIDKNYHLQQLLALKEKINYKYLVLKIMPLLIKYVMFVLQH